MKIYFLFFLAFLQLLTVNLLFCQRQTLAFEHATFTLSCPAVLGMFDKKKQELEDYRKMAPKMAEILEQAQEGQPIKGYKLESSEFQVTLNFEEFDYTPNFNSDAPLPCKNDKKPDAPIEVKAEFWNLGSLKVCAVYTWEYEIEGPNQVKDDITGHIRLSFKLDKAWYKLEIGIRNLDQHDIKGKVMQMARSLRLGNESDEDSPGEEDVPEEDSPKGGCKLKSEMQAAPRAAFGIIPREPWQIRRDDFIPISARASDPDQIRFVCEVEEPCSGKGETSHLALQSGMALHWKITSGNASFVDLGCLPSKQRRTTGENVVLMPPTDLKVGETETIVIQLSAISLSPRNPVDKLSPVTVRVNISRSPSVEEVYDISLEGPPYVAPGVPLNGLEKAGDCKAVKEYQPGSHLKAEILLPDVPDNQGLIPGERIILRAKPVVDVDTFTVECQHPDCESDGKRKFIVNDAAVYHWKLEFGDGYFEVNGQPSRTATGDAVIYRAPSLPTQVRSERISLTVKNLPGKLKDKDSEPAEVSLNIFRGQIVVENLPADFLPVYDRSPYPIKVYFSVYHPSRRGVELPAFAHLSTLVNFQLSDVSSLTGVCTNFELAANSTDGPEGNKPDMFFDAKEMYDDYRCYEWSKLDRNRCMYAERKDLLKGQDTIRLPVSIRDYGAYGELLLKTVNQAAYEVNMLSPYQIPVDRDHDGIGDASQMHEDYNPVWDEEQRGGVTDENKSGDGFTTFEEYRGFRYCRMNSCVSPDHIRTDPGRVDLFVHSKVVLTLNRFERAADIDAHFIASDMMSEEKVINWISEVGKDGKRGDQFGLWIESGIPPLSSNVPVVGVSYNYQKPQHNNLGIAILRSGNFEGEPHLPRQVDKILLNLNKIRADGQDVEEVVAHEMGHGCYLQHHGAEASLDGGSFGVRRCAYDPSVQNNGVCEDLFTMHAGSKYSGDMRCMMRYDAKTLAEAPGRYVIRCAAPCNSNTITTDTLRNLRIVWDEPAGWRDGLPGSQVLPRDQFCRNNGGASPLGACATGRGNCYYAIKVKCW